MSEKKARPRLLQIAGQIKRTKDDSISRPSGGFLSTHAPHLSDAAFLSQNARPDELAALRKAVEARQAKEPAFSYFICENPACGWRMKTKYDPEDRRRFCLRCNFDAFLELKGWMRRMTKEEVAKYEADVKADFERAVERGRQAAFNLENESRAKHGFALLSREEFDEMQKRNWRQKLEREAKLQKQHQAILKAEKAHE